MVCNKCNKQNPYGSAFCNYCGEPFENGGAAISPPMMNNQSPKVAQPVQPVQPVQPAQPVVLVKTGHVAPQIQTERAAVGTTLTYENLDAQKKIKGARNTASIGLAMGIIGLFSIVLGLFFPLMFACVFLLPIPALICSSISNSGCRKFKKDEAYEEEIKKIKTYNRYAKLTAILTIIFTILIIIAIIAIVVLFSVASLDSALGKFSGTLSGLTRIIDFIESYL